MKKLLFLFSLSLCFTLSCNSNADEFPNLKESVITENEFGPYGDEAFCSLIKDFILELSNQMQRF